MPPPPSQPSGNTDSGVIAQDIALNIAYFGVSFIPLIGNTVAIGELLYAYASDKDILGNDVDDVDKTIMALGILLPHVSKVPGVRNVLKSMINFLKREGFQLRMLYFEYLKREQDRQSNSLQMPGKVHFME